MKDNIMPIKEDDIEYQIILNFLTDGTIIMSSTTENFTDQLNLIHIAYISILKSINEDRPARLS